jgi:hypothetical protein
MTTLIISILSLGISAFPNQTITKEIKFDFPTYSECLRTKQEYEILLRKMNEGSILGYSMVCKG